MKQAAYKVLANAQDITALIKDRLLKLSVHDAAGIESDTVTIELDNRDNAVRFPATGASLDVYLGMGDALVFKGTFEVDELEESLGDDVLSIHGKAAKMKGSLKAPRDATFDAITLRDLVGQIAAAHGYQPAVASELAGVTFAHIDQVGESDMNLLTRLAREHGAIAKPVADRLVLVPRGASKAVSGRDLPVIEISDPGNSAGRITIQERNDYRSALAYWFDEASQQKVPETAGDGEPRYTLRQPFATQSAAQAGATAKLKQLRRGKGVLTLTRPLAPDIVPESRLNLTGHKPSANGVWLVDEVDHVVESSGTAYSAVSAVIPE